MSASKIEWTEATWNPVTGCTKISSGCKNCYAERMAKRLQAMGSKNYINGFQLTCHPDTLTLPLTWKKSKKIFVNSMSDLFHEDIEISFLESIFKTMNAADWHNFQVLTKRAKYLSEVSNRLNWNKNIWMGVTVEATDYLDRIDYLRTTGAQVKFLSLEPLIGPIDDINLSGIDWVIVGGESGPGARPMNKEWVINIKESCEKQNVPFFFKQWGGINKKKTGRVLEGQVWNEAPVFA
jgi:protein gp37